jgi:hypothetical protein
MAPSGGKFRPSHGPTSRFVPGIGAVPTGPRTNTEHRGTRGIGNNARHNVWTRDGVREKGVTSRSSPNAPARQDSDIPRSSNRQPELGLPEFRNPLQFLGQGLSAAFTQRRLELQAAGERQQTLVGQRTRATAHYRPSRVDDNTSNAQVCDDGTVVKPVSPPPAYPSAMRTGCTKTYLKILPRQE